MLAVCTISFMRVQVLSCQRELVGWHGPQPEQHISNVKHFHILCISPSLIWTLFFLYFPPTFKTLEQTHTHTNLALGWAFHNTNLNCFFSLSWWTSEKLKEGEIDRIKTEKERWGKEPNPRLIAVNKVWLLLTRHSGFLIDTCNSMGAQMVTKRRLFFCPAGLKCTTAHCSPNHKMKGNMAGQNEPKLLRVMSMPRNKHRIY